jgi:hypothetical protein
MFDGVDRRTTTGSWWTPAAWHDVPAAGPRPDPMAAVDSHATRVAVGVAPAPVTAGSSAGSLLPTRAPGIALLAEFAEVLLSEHQPDQDERCRTCGLPVARCWVLGRAREYGLTGPYVLQPNDYRPQH